MGLAGEDLPPRRLPEVTCPPGTPAASDMDMFSGAISAQQASKAEARVKFWHRMGAADIDLERRDGGRESERARRKEKKQERRTGGQRKSNHAELHWLAVSGGGLEGWDSQAQSATTLSRPCSTASRCTSNSSSLFVSSTPASHQKAV